MFSRAFQNQAGRRIGHGPPGAHADLLAPAKVISGQRVSAPQFLGRAIEHDLSAPLARTGTHVDHAVGRQHHGRVMLHHDQRVTGVSQPLHRFGDAVHVARMQADAGLVQHEQRVHQRGAERRRQVDPLHFAAGERATLPVQRQVSDANIHQVFQSRGDLLEKQLQRLMLAVVAMPIGLGRHPVKELSQPVDGHQHQVVQAQARQRLELLAGPVDTDRHEAPRRLQHRVRIFLAADAPDQAVRLQPGARANMAGRVAAVLRQQHADVHLVRLALQVFEKALDAVPLLVPVAVLVVRVATDDPLLLVRSQLVPGRVARNARGFGVLHQLALRFGPGWRLDCLDRTGTQRELVVRDHQPVVDADDAAEAAAGFAGPDRGIEREHRRDRIGIAQVALRAVQAGGEFPDVGFGF